MCALLFSVICYWSIGLHPGANEFFKFLAFLYLAVLAAEFQTLLISAIVPIFIAALAISAFSFGFWMVSNDFSSHFSDPFPQGSSPIFSPLDLQPISPLASPNFFFIRQLKDTS